MSGYASDTSRKSTTSQSSQSSLVRQLTSCGFQDPNSAEYNEENNNDENKNDIKMINDLEASVSSSEDEESSYDSNINYSYNINRHKYKYKNKNKCNNVNRSRLLSPPINHYNVFKENHNN
eukprot:279210_1